MLKRFFACLDIIKAIHIQVSIESENKGYGLRVNDVTRLSGITKTLPH
jgi:hypothetical protein